MRRTFLPLAIFFVLLAISSPAAASVDTGRITFLAVGSWSASVNLSDGDLSTTAKSETVPARAMILLNDEQVLRRIRIHYRTPLKRATVKFSKDALVWGVPALEVTDDKNGKYIQIDFAPEACRAIMVGFEAEQYPVEIAELELFSADRSKVEVYAVTFTDVTENSATVRWKTTLPAKTSLLYGFSMDRLNPLSTLSYELSSEHSAALTGLMPGMDYFVWILVGLESSAGDVDSKPFRFRTKGIPYPYSYAVSPSVGRDTAAIKALTNIPCRASLLWRRAGTNEELSSPRTGADTVSHTLLLANLTPRTEYEYQVLTADSKNRTTATPWMSFMTLTNNIAIGKPVRGTFENLEEDQTKEDTRDALLRITDGRDDFFTGMATSSDPDDTDQWVEVDLQGEKMLTTVEMTWRANACPMNYYLMVSKDGNQWRYPGFNLNAVNGEFERSTRGDPLRRVAVAIDGEAVRYIRVFIPRKGQIHTKYPYWRFVQLAEIEAHEVWNK